jgi:hypothetical protein
VSGGVEFYFLSCSQYALAAELIKSEFVTLLATASASTLHYHVYDDEQYSTLAPPITAFQVFLHVSENQPSFLDTQITAKTMVCVFPFGPIFDAIYRLSTTSNYLFITDLITSNNSTTQWANFCRYLGVYFVNGRFSRRFFHEAKCN